MHTHYDTLGVARTAPVEVIKAAFQVLSQRLASDPSLTPAGASQLRDLKGAWAILGNPSSRAEYDLWIEEEGLRRALLEPRNEYQPNSSVHESRIKQRQEALQSVRPEFRSSLGMQFLKGLDCDQLPAARGPFGSRNNPIPVNGSIGELKYLSKLRGQAGSLVMFHRTGSMSSEACSNPVDCYEIVASDGTQWRKLFFDCYHPRRSELSPSGYSLAPVDRSTGIDLPFGLGSNSLIADFPHKLPVELVRFYGESPGLVLADAVRRILLGASFTRPDGYDANGWPLEAKPTVNRNSPAQPMFGIFQSIRGFCLSIMGWGHLNDAAVPTESNAPGAADQSTTRRNSPETQDTTGFGFSSRAIIGILAIGVLIFIGNNHDKNRAAPSSPQPRDATARYSIDAPILDTPVVSDPQPLVGTRISGAEPTGGRTNLEKLLRKVESEKAQRDRPNPCIGRPSLPPGVVFPSETGYIDNMPSQALGGLSSLTIDNTQRNSDAYIKLCPNPSKKCNDHAGRHAFVMRGTSLTMEKVRPGRYEIRYADRDTCSLAKSDPFELSEIRSNEGVEYSVVTMTLYTVASGNMSYETVDPQDF